MKIDSSTCWYNDDVCPEQMIQGAKGLIWPVLEKSDHFPILDSLIQIINDDCTSLLDIGCGAAEISRIYPQYFYVGADLKNIIQNVSTRVHPEKRYVVFDIYNDECEFISDYDIIVMNAFIDVLEFPIFGLETVLKHANRYVVLHRQEVDSQQTRIIKNPSYGGVSYHSIINKISFDYILNKHSFEIVKQLPVFNNSKSYLLRKVI
jgi:hypothetical protein